MCFAKKENETWSISVYCLLGTTAQQVFKTEKKIKNKTNDKQKPVAWRVPSFTCISLSPFCIAKSILKNTLGFFQIKMMRFHEVDLFRCHFYRSLVYFTWTVHCGTFPGKKPEGFPGLINRKFYYKKPF